MAEVSLASLLGVVPWALRKSTCSLPRHRPGQSAWLSAADAPGEGEVM